MTRAVIRRSPTGGYQIRAVCAESVLSPPVPTRILEYLPGSARPWRGAVDLPAVLVVAAVSAATMLAGGVLVAIATWAGCA